MPRSPTRLLVTVLCAAAVVILSALPGGAAVRAQASTPSAARAHAQKVGADAYLYGIPLMEFLRVARQQTSVTVPDRLGDAPTNRLGNARALSNPTERTIVQPNNDTLYTLGHLDLGSGPLVLHVPAIPANRYYSFEFLDPYTNVFHYIGTRTTGTRAGNYAIVGPSFHGALPRGVRRITSGYRRAWIVGRTLVTGPGDLAAAHRVQDAYRLIPLAAFRRVGLNWRPPKPRRILTRPTVFTEPTGVAFFDALGDALAKNPPPARDRAILRELASVGIGPGRHPTAEHLSAATLAGLRAAVAGGPAAVYALRITIAVPSVRAHSGWFVPPPDTASYGTDYKFRAVVALNGIAANRPAEAMYVIGTTDPNFSLLNGNSQYVIHFPAGKLPPARYFWSLTMYDKSFYLVANPLNRYEIGDRTRGLRYNPDGSLDLYIQSTAPTGHESNWLPCPAAGPFEMTLRLYGPKPSALRGSYIYPPIAKVG